MSGCTKSDQQKGIKEGSNLFSETTKVFFGEVIDKKQAKQLKGKGPSPRPCKIFKSIATLTNSKVEVIDSHSFSA